MFTGPVPLQFKAMEPPNAASESATEEIDLRALFDTIWSGRWLIIAVAGAFTLVGVGYSLLAQEWYRAEVILAPAAKKGASGALSQVGSLASLAGINLQGPGEGEPVAVLKSREFARSFISDLGLTTVLAQPPFWSKEQTDIRDAVKMFDSKIRIVSEDKKTGLVTLSIRWKDPETAASWANLLVTRLNDRLRTQAAAEADRNVSYLQKQIAGTSVIALQQSLGRVLEGELQKLLLAQGNEEFAFKVIDRATPPKQRDAPRRTFITLLAAVTGTFFGLILVFLRKAIATVARRT
jgi:uncharacterized protein involved in exopolysaccharide biosynthesis